MHTAYRLEQHMDVDIASYDQTGSVKCHEPEDKNA
jgi:hypothetical protein